MVFLTHTTLLIFLSLISGALGADNATEGHSFPEAIINLDYRTAPDFNQTAFGLEKPALASRNFHGLSKRIRVRPIKYCPQDCYEDRSIPVHATGFGGSFRAHGFSPQHWWLDCLVGRVADITPENYFPCLGVCAADELCFDRSYELGSRSQAFCIRSPRKQLLPPAGLPTAVRGALITAGAQYTDYVQVILTTGSNFERSLSVRILTVYVYDGSGRVAGTERCTDCDSLSVSYLEKQSVSVHAQITMRSENDTGFINAFFGN